MCFDKVGSILVLHMYVMLLDNADAVMDKIDVKQRCVKQDMLNLLLPNHCLTIKSI